MDFPTSPTTNDGPFLLPDHMRCTYRSKACANERARKRNGTVHKLCQEHRVKANINQRNMQKRLRARRQLELASGAFPAEMAVPGAADTSALLSAATTSFQDMLMDGDDDNIDNDWAMCDLEPLCTPSELMPEDLEVLQLLWDQQQASTATDMDTTPAHAFEASPSRHAANTSAPHQYTHCAVF